MSKHSRDIELLRQNDNDLMVQYEALLCLRAELARLLFPLKISPPRKYRFKRRNWSAARPVKQHERPASCAPIFVQIPFPKKHLPPHRVCFMTTLCRLHRTSLILSSSSETGLMLADGENSMRCSTCTTSGRLWNATASASVSRSASKTWP